MELEDLDDLFEDLDIDNPTKDQLYKMYGIYLNDYFHPMYFVGPISIVPPLTRILIFPGYNMIKRLLLFHKIAKVL